MAIRQPISKLDTFTAAIEEIATDREALLLKQAKERRSGLIAAATERIKREAEYAYQERTATLAKELAAIRSADIAALRNRLFEQRRELSEQLFSEAKLRLSEFAASPNYEGFLLELALKLAVDHDCSAAEISLRPADRRYLRRLKEIFPGDALFIFDESIELGGIIVWLPKQQLIIDQRLETRLDEQRDWFYQHCGLSTAW